MRLTTASRDSFRSARAVSDWTKGVGNLRALQGGFDGNDACCLAWLYEGEYILNNDIKSCRITHDRNYFEFCHAFTHVISQWLHSTGFFSLSFTN